MYKFNAPLEIIQREATKRKILSCIAQIFDLMGIIAPVVVLAKILMQRIWDAKIGWDTVIPDQLFLQWDQFQRELQHTTELKIPRWVGLDMGSEIEIHGFSDASTSAYGAVLFMRAKKNDHIECTMIAAKSRVAPLKPLSIPRLELCAAHILSELVRTFLEAVKLRNSRVTLWTDSQIVLAWLKKDPGLLKTFVNNRVQNIHRTAPQAEWRYVPSADNPADILSRGAFPKELMSASLWWKGPPWLSRSQDNWPNTASKINDALKFEIEREENHWKNEGKIRTKYKQIAIYSLSINGV